MIQPYLESVCEILKDLNEAFKRLQVLVDRL